MFSRRSIRFGIGFGDLRESDVSKSGHRLWVRNWALVGSLFLALSALSACVPASVKMSKLSERNDFERVAKSGRAWLAEADREDKASPEGQRIQSLVANAELKLLMQKRDYKALKAYRDRYQGKYPQLEAQAESLEAQLFYAEVTQRGDTPEAYQRFRLAYPTAPLGEKSKQAEVAAALRILKSQPDEAKAREYYAAYQGWTGAEPLLAFAERVYTERTIERLDREGQVDELRAYRLKNVEILERLKLSKKAFEAELKNAYQRISKSEERNAFIGFIKKYEAAGSEHPLIVSARRAADGKIRADFEAARDSQAPGALAAFRAKYEPSDADHSLILESIEIEMKREYDGLGTTADLAALTQFVSKHHALGRNELETYKEAQRVLYTRALEPLKGTHEVVRVSEFHMSWKINTDLTWTGKRWKGTFEGRKRRLRPEALPPTPLISVQENLDLRLLWKGKTLATLSIAPGSPNAWAFDPEGRDSASAGLILWRMETPNEEMAEAGEAEVLTACFGAPWTLIATPTGLKIDCSQTVDAEMVFDRAR